MPERQVITPTAFHTVAQGCESASYPGLRAMYNSSAEQPATCTEKTLPRPKRGGHLSNQRETQRLAGGNERKGPASTSQMRVRRSVGVHARAQGSPASTSQMRVRRSVKTLYGNDSLPASTSQMRVRRSQLRVALGNAAPASTSQMRVRRSFTSGIR